MMHKFSRREFTAISASAVPSLWLHPNWVTVAADRTAGPAAFVNPLIGASTSQALGEGKTFPGPATPFGMVQLGPDTITGGDNAPGYSYEHQTIEGFSFTRMSGVGWYGDFGNLQVMPTIGPMRLASGRVDRPGEGWRSRFRHATEMAQTNYYAVDLDDYGIRAELTAAQRAGMLVFTFPESGKSRIQLDLARRIGGTSTRQFIKVTDSNSVEGWMNCPPSGGGWGNGEGKVGYTLYFRVEFSKPLVDFGVTKVEIPEGMFPPRTGLVTDFFQTDAYYELVGKGQILRGNKEQEGGHLGFFLEFATRSDERVMVKAGISFVSVEGARKNLGHDIPNWDFDEVRRKGVADWNRVLRGIEIEGASPTEKTIFSTALYHAMLDPRVISDTDGKYRAADGATRVAEKYQSRTIFSGWDVFRAEFPLLTLLNPAVIQDEINSLIELAQVSKKGYLERWEIMNSYSGCMDGDPATSVILDAYQKGIRGFDIAQAYAACRQTAAGSNQETNRPDNEFYAQHGFVPNRVSWTLDNVYYDWCVGKFAELLGKRDDAKLFRARAANYKKIYDPSVRSMRARNEKGEWIPWEGPLTFGQGCTESNPEQQTWFVPHDVQGLIELMGRDEFVARLEKFFENTPATFAWNDYYNHSNEPVHHVPYLFVYAGKPWLTQKWVRRILQKAYRNEVNGLVGNDDVGQISAWYVMSAMGFYPVCPGDNTYILGGPLFQKATVYLPQEWYQGKAFTVVAENQAPDHCYVRSARLNGKVLSRAWITHQEIVNGGTLEFVMDAIPNEKWASSEDDFPPSMTARRSAA